MVTTLTDLGQSCGVTVRRSAQPHHSSYPFTDFRDGHIFDRQLPSEWSWSISRLRRGRRGQYRRHPASTARSKPDRRVQQAAWQAQFCSQSYWLYTLQRSGDFQSWTNVSPATPGNGTNLCLQDTNPPPDKAFYRVSASRP